MATFETTYDPGIHALARHLEHLPPQPLRRAVVLVPAERHAHAVRRHVVVDRERPGDLAGVLFTRPVELARQFMLRAGHVCLPGWEGIRRLRILTLLENRELDGTLAYFDPVQLRSGQGYAVAFSRTIEELEASGLDPESCAGIAARLQREGGRNGDRLHDVAVVWAGADREHGARVSAPQLLTAAARLLAERPDLSTLLGPTYALLSSSPSTALLRFLRCLDGCTVVFQEARPWRTGTQRWREPLHLEQPAPAAGESELALVRRYLFELPERLTDPQRPRSAGPDSTVDLEEYSTIEDEIEAAAIWVNEQIERGTPLEQIALVAPEIQPYTLALTDRLARTCNGEATRSITVHTAGGVSLADTAAGRRFQILLDALLHSLESEATIRLIPALRRGPTEAADSMPRLSPSRAAEIVYGAGITGGSPGDSGGVSEWVERLTRRRDALRQVVAEADEEDEGRDEPEKRKQLIGRHHANRWLRDIDPVLPGIEALQRVAESVVAGAPLTAVWTGVHEFAKNWLRLPPDPPNLLALLAQRVQPILADPVASAIKGSAAIRFLMDQLRSESLMENRFGEPCVFVGSTAQAAGLSFAAVRLLGLAEGALPHTPHDDPIVPDVVRGRVEELAREKDPDVIVPRLSDRVLDEIHDAYRVINGTRERLALSAPRQWTDRSDREVSGVMLEVATALGREAAGAGGDVPTSGRLRSAYFGPGRHARAVASEASPLTPRALLSSVASGETRGVPDDATLHVPSGWLARAATDIGHLHQLAEQGEGRELTALDGVIPQTWSGFSPPGLGDKPLSASALNILLSCPHRFMLERLIRLGPPATRPSTDAIDPIAYGSLFHAAVERFLREAGPALCRREGLLKEWVERAKTVAAEELDELMHVYPLRGGDAIERERLRLLRQIEHLVEYEWAKPRREFVATELGFGEPDPVRLGADGAALGVRGAIDRVDRLDAGSLAVRDIKTGRVYDLTDEPINAGRDLQIGLYTLALEAGGSERVTEAAYVHPSAVHEQQRAFAEDELDRLREHTRSWLRTAHEILAAGMFVRTPNPDDCRFCSFVPACGDGAQQLSAAKLSALPQTHPLAPFVRLKQEKSSEE